MLYSWWQNDPYQWLYATPYGDFGRYSDDGEDMVGDLLLGNVAQKHNAEFGMSWVITGCISEEDVKE